MDLPRYIRTKAEALALVAEIIPDHNAEALRLQRAAVPLPRYHIRFTMTDRLRDVFVWLFDDKTRIYKRARWWLFYELAMRVYDQIDENGAAKQLDLSQEGWTRDRERRAAGIIMAGDGQGI